VRDAELAAERERAAVAIEKERARMAGEEEVQRNLGNRIADLLEKRVEAVGKTSEVLADAQRRVVCSQCCYINGHKCFYNDCVLACSGYVPPMNLLSLRSFDPPK
jgi:hypothetical protein